MLSYFCVRGEAVEPREMEIVIAHLTRENYTLAGRRSTRPTDSNLASLGFSCHGIRNGTRKYFKYYVHDKKKKSNIMTFAYNMAIITRHFCAQRPLLGER